MLLVLAATVTAHARLADSENCELCHGLPLLARLDEGGQLRLFEVSATMVQHSSHRGIGCRDCHSDIDAFPHPERVQPVDCGKTCHVNRPFELTVFSHRAEVEALALSIHGRNDKENEETNAAKPTCKYCHGSHLMAQPSQRVQEQARHCASCHDGNSLESVIEHVDRHTSHRSAENSINIVKLCASCHGDATLMESVNLSSTQVAGFQHHFHGKAMRRGLDGVANCADCHTSHLVLPQDDPASTLSTANIRQTCGTVNCHVNPSLEFARSAIHSQPTMKSNPVVYAVSWGFILLTAITMALLFSHILLDFGRWLHDRFTTGGRHEGK
ncbi:MAG: hypothetical protein Q8O14_08590 [bacterium]|jgi:hypothetical protein|nr:hypothetical protein [bacterium]